MNTAVASHSDAGRDPTSPFLEEHEMFRQTVRNFLDRELEPNYKKFEAAGEVSRDFWRAAGAAGLLGTCVPEEYGGAGADAIFQVILSHEWGRSIGAWTVGSSIQADLVTEVLVKSGTEAHRRKWAPLVMSGDAIQAMAMTEAGAGSDATAIRTTALRDGDHYVINGSKIFTSNGCKADVIYLVVKTDPTQRSRGMSVILVEGDRPGISRHRMKTMGASCSDVAELHFDNVRVPVTNLMGEEGGGLKVIMALMNMDRLTTGAISLGACELAFSLTLDYVKQRKVRGQPLFEYQNTQFKLAEMKTEIEVGRSFLYDGVRKYLAGTLDANTSAMTKLWLPEMESRVMDTCLQLHGGSGYMDEMPISRLYTATRVHRIYAGTSEVMKVTIGRSL